MAVKAVVETLDGVDEALHGLYAKGEDGKFRLELEGAETAEDVAGLKKALEVERKRAREYEKRVKALPDGLDERLEELELLRKEREDREARKAEETGQWDKLKAQLQEQAAKERERLQKEIEGRDGKIDLLIRRNEVTRELVAADGYPEIMEPHVLGRTQTIQEDGEWKVIVVDTKGERRLGKDGNDMTIKDLVAEMSELPQFAPGFRGSDATGGGASGRRVAGGGNSRTKPLKDMTEAEKQDYISEHGLEAWQQKVFEAYG